MNEPVTSVTAEESPWADVVRHAEHGNTVAVLAHGGHAVPSGELQRLRETIEVLSDTDLIRDVLEGLADARAGRVPPRRTSLRTWRPVVPPPGRARVARQFRRSRPEGAAPYDPSRA